MGNVVCPVPRVETHEMAHLVLPRCRMHVAPGKIALAHCSHDAHPPIVHRIEQRQRRLDRRRTGIFEQCPRVLVVCLDNGRFFRERELDPHVRIEM